MDRRLSAFSRRQLGGLSLAGAAFLAGCGRKPSAAQEGSLDWAVSGRWRAASDKARDPYRHPVEMLTFFEIKPKDTVIDMWPGAGYMTEILAPYLTHGKGDYLAALFEAKSPADKATASLSDRYRTHFSSNKKLYGAIDYTEFGPASPALAPAGSVDCVLFLLVIQDWMAAGIAEKAFADAFAALKPGGILGIEQHRADIGHVHQDPAATNGYVQEPFVKQLAGEAGFTFVASSEMNANPKDDKDHPFGVWTLPPQRLTAPRGQPPNPEFDGSLYESIGESDRMTMKFRKPQ
jgi:predicted methyltransferase